MELRSGSAQTIRTERESSKGAAEQARSKDIARVAESPFRIHVVGSHQTPAELGALQHLGQNATDC